MNHSKKCRNCQGSGTIEKITDAGKVPHYCPHCLGSGSVAKPPRRSPHRRHPRARGLAN